MGCFVCRLLFAVILRCKLCVLVFVSDIVFGGFAFVFVVFDCYIYWLIVDCAVVVVGLRLLRGVFRDLVWFGCDCFTLGVCGVFGFVISG